MRAPAALALTSVLESARRPTSTGITAFSTASSLPSRGALQQTDKIHM